VNLLQNARQHSPDDQPVRLDIDLPRPSAIRIRIIDRGPGIDPEVLPRVFEPFYTTRKAGTGLGLSIVHRIVALHGGDIKLYNNDPGPGLTAEVWLPTLGA
jgi:signal transduction histidine kinase